MNLNSQKRALPGAKFHPSRTTHGCELSQDTASSFEWRGSAAQQVAS